MYGWFGLMLDASRIALEAQEVVALRLEKLAKGGPAAPVEALAMVAEKGAAMGEAWLAASAAMMKGGDMHRTTAAFLNPYRKRVRANRRRLSR